MPGPRSASSRSGHSACSQTLVQFCPAATRAESFCRKSSSSSHNSIWLAAVPVRTAIYASIHAQVTAYCTSAGSYEIEDCFLALHVLDTCRDEAACIYRVYNLNRGLCRYATAVADVTRVVLSQDLFALEQNCRDFVGRETGNAPGVVPEGTGEQGLANRYSLQPLPDDPTGVSLERRHDASAEGPRSEERRGGQECRGRGSTAHVEGEERRRVLPDECNSG